MFAITRCSRIPGCLAVAEFGRDGRAMGIVAKPRIQDPTGRHRTLLLRSARRRYCREFATIGARRARNHRRDAAYLAIGQLHVERLGRGYAWSTPAHPTASTRLPNSCACSRSGRAFAGLARGGGYRMGLNRTRRACLLGEGTQEIGLPQTIGRISIGDCSRSDSPVDSEPNSFTVRPRSFVPVLLKRPS